MSDITPQQKAQKLIAEFEQYCNKLVNIHVPDYKFVWSNSKNMFGYCYYEKKTVEVSMVNFLLNPHTGDDTIRHEIAHALVPKNGHNNIWRQAAIRMGANPRSCVQGEITQLFKWEIYCKQCGKFSRKRHNKAKSYKNCPYCKSPVWQR